MRNADDGVSCFEPDLVVANVVLRCAALYQTMDQAIKEPPKSSVNIRSSAQKSDAATAFPSHRPRRRSHDATPSQIHQPNTPHHPLHPVPLRRESLGLTPARLVITTPSTFSTGALPCTRRTSSGSLFVIFQARQRSRHDRF